MASSGDHRHNHKTRLPARCSCGREAAYGSTLCRNWQEAHGLDREQNQRNLATGEPTVETQRFKERRRAEREASRRPRRSTP